MTAAEAPVVARPRPMIFLVGPPGAGKTTLGSRACKNLGLEFLEFADAPVVAPVDADDLERLSWVVAHRAADVIELPWHLQHERKVLHLARRCGALLLLWAHPEEMQARSGHADLLFTPVARLKIRGGFGRYGTGCREFRRLDRACSETLFLVDLPFEEAAQVVKARIAEIREEYDRPPAEREGLAGWEDDWRRDHNASPHVSRVIIEAMARYLAHLRATGTSPRTLSGVRSDLNAAGHLVLMYEVTKGKKIFRHFDGPPWEFEFQRKFTNSPALVARYRRSLEGFASFLKECGDLTTDEE